MRRLQPGWIPGTLLAVGLVGIVGGIALTLNEGEAGDWLAGRVGGSSLYALNLAFARVLPFVIVTAIGLALLQRGRTRPHRDAPGAEEVTRHELAEVLVHWTNAVGVGLALLSAAWMLTWLSNPLSLEVTYALHFLGAGLSVGAIAHHLAYEVAGGHAGLIPRRWSDVKDAVAEIVSYAGVFRGRRGAFGLQLPVIVRRRVQAVVRALRLTPSLSGKYLATERVLSYPVWFTLLAVVVVTGIAKSVHYVVALPGGLRGALTFVHDGAAIFIAVFLVVHVAALVTVPRNWPLLKSMFTTRIRRAYVQEHLPEWERELEAAREGADGAADGGAVAGR